MEVIDLTNDNDNSNDNDNDNIHLDGRNDNVVDLVENADRKRSCNDGTKDTFIIVTINIDDLKIDKLISVVENIAETMVEQDHEGGNPDLIFIQETKLASKGAVAKVRAQIEQLGYFMHHNEILSNRYEFKHGNCLLVKKQSKLNDGGSFETFDWDLEGRVVVWKCNYGIFLGVHAATPNKKPDKATRYRNSRTLIPKRYEQRQAFDNNIQNYIKNNREQRTVIIVGDFNVSLEARDSSGKLWSTEHYEKCRERHIKLKNDCHLVDIWRFRNPTTLRRYTSWINHLEPKSQARIDMILIPRTLENDVQYIEIMDNDNFCNGARGDINRTVKFNLNHVPVVMKMALAPDMVDNRTASSDIKRIRY